MDIVYQKIILLALKNTDGIHVDCETLRKYQEAEVITCYHSKIPLL